MSTAPRVQPPQRWRAPRRRALGGRRWPRQCPSRSVGLDEDGIITLDSQLDHAYDSYQQQARFEEEQSKVVEQSPSPSDCQAIIVALVMLVVLLIVYIIA